MGELEAVDVNEGEADSLSELVMLPDCVMVGEIVWEGDCDPVGDCTWDRLALSLGDGDPEDVID